MVILSQKMDLLHWTVPCKPSLQSKVISEISIRIVELCTLPLDFSKVHAKDTCFKIKRCELHQLGFYCIQPQAVLKFKLKIPSESLCAHFLSFCSVVVTPQLIYSSILFLFFSLSPFMGLEKNPSQVQRSKGFHTVFFRLWKAYK